MARSHPIARLAAASLLVVSLAACSASENGDPADVGGTTPASGGFPVTIEHAYGETVIEEEPTRVATVGWSSQDIVYSYGVTPVAIEADRWAGDDDGYQPWLREAIEADGGELPAVFDVYPEIDIDALIEAEPDLILAPLSGISQEQYDQLSKIARTVAFPETAWTTTWQEVITITGQALGQPERAPELIAEIEDRVAAAAAEHPEFEGLTFAYVYAGVEPGNLDVYSDGDARVDLISGLGLTHDPAVVDLPVSPGMFTTTLGLENADTLNDVDVLFTWFNDEAEEAAAAAQPLWAQIPAVERGSIVSVLDRQLGMASTVVTPLSLPWSIDRFIPLMLPAVEKAG